MRYPKEVVLKEGREAVIRPLQRDDEEMLRRFYAGIPERDRWFMRHDVMDPAVIAKWMDDVDTNKVYAIIALAEGRIVGHASLHMREFGSTRHMGRFRLMVLPEFRYKRLGTWLLLDLIQLAMDKGLSEVRADFVVGIEDAAIEAANKFDFFEKAVLKDYVRDEQGNRRDLLIMIKRLHKSWGDF
ncbi:MAG: GNAT family N-acetyltransferase [Thermodesulfobacteriota bacterium]